MPANFPPEYYEAKEKYEAANGLNEKIKYTNKMISAAPSHKGAEKVLKNLKKRLKSLKEKQEKRKEIQKGSYSISVEKQGFQICIAGYPNTGKSTLLKELTNADPEVANYPHTTKEPEVGMLEHRGAQLQLVDLPPIKEGAVENQGEVMSIIKNTDGVILMLGNNPGKEKKALKKEMKKIDAEKPTMTVKRGNIPSKDDVFDFFDLIKIYTKKPGKEPEKDDPLVMKRNSTVEEVGKEIHKDFSNKLKYARVWGSSKFDGQRVKKDYVLKDEDVVEFHI